MWTLTEPNVGLEDKELTQAVVLDKLERAGRTCYKSEPSSTSSETFVRRLIKNGHESVLEHVSVSLRLSTDRGMCYSDDTEVLTRVGWKLFKDVVYEDELAGLSDAGQLVWDHPTQLISQEYAGEMVHVNMSCVSLCVTPEHNMWVFDYDKRSTATRTWKFLRAEQLVNKRYGFTKTARWLAPPATIRVPAHPTEHRAYPELTFTPAQTLDMFELLGIWATDGSLDRGGTGHNPARRSSSGARVVITQVKRAGVKRILELCTSLGLHATRNGIHIRIDNLRLYNFIAQLFGTGPKSFTVRVPTLVKEASADQIRRFVDGVILGDGSVHSTNGHRVIYTASKLFADDLQELCLKLNLSANVRNIAARTRKFSSGHISYCKPSYVVSIVEHRRSCQSLLVRSPTTITRRGYSGRVYCATVPTHRLYVRRHGRGVWCGNSHELVRHRIASFSQQSTRYCDLSGCLEFVKPSGLTDDAAVREWSKCMDAAAEAYINLRTQGVSPQVARSVLPTCLRTELVMTANLREWRHILRQRWVGTTGKPHPDMVLLMDQVATILKSNFPVIFEDIVKQ